MNNKKHTMETRKDVGRILSLTAGMALILALTGSPAFSADDARTAKREQAKVEVSPKQAEAKSPAEPAPAVKDIRLSFKLDPRLTRSLHMGDRWVSPSVYIRVGEGKEVTVEARVQAVDAKGKAVDVGAEWTPADPEMVTVTAAQGPKGRGRQFNITVRRAGETILKVASQDVTKELIVKATPKGSTIQVEISPKRNAAEQASEKAPGTRR